MAVETAPNETSELTVYLIENEDRKSTRLEVPDAGVSQTLRLPTYDGSRYLMSLGYSHDTVLHTYRRLRNGRTMRAFKPMTLGYLGQWTVKETDKGGLRKTRYQPMPDEAIWSRRVAA